MTARFSGLIPPIITPLTDEGRLDVESLSSLVEFQLAAGVNGLFVLGSSGEAIYLTDTARREVVEAAAAIVDHRVPLLVGALEATPARVADQIGSIGGLGADAIVVTAPFYANLAEHEVADHFRSAADATDLPILAYDIPGNVGRRIPLTVLTALLADGTIAGLKDSSGSLTEFRRALDAAGTDRSGVLLSGADILADLALDLGADGLIPGLANVRPDLFVALLRAHAADDRATVAAYQRAITDLTDIFGAGQPFGLGRHASELGALKHLLHRQGIIASTHVSPPLSRYSADALREVERIHDQMQARLEETLATRVPAP